jgi:hypothetical protein
MNRQDQMDEWGRTYYGAVWTALSNSVQFWADAMDSQANGEPWMLEMAKSQHASYSKALAGFEELF